MGKIKKSAGPPRHGSKPKGGDRRAKNVKSQKEKSGGGDGPKSVRYFNSPLGSSSSSEGKFQKQDIKSNRKKGRNEKRGGGNNFHSGSAPPPKPKRLGKGGPFKLKHKDDPQQQHGVHGVSPKNKAKFRPRKGEKNFKDEAEIATEFTKTKETDERIQNIRKNKQNAKGNLKMLVKPGGKWYDEQPNDSQSTSSDGGVSGVHQDMKQGIKLSKDEISSIRYSAEKLFDQDCLAYRQACFHGEQKSDFQWMEKMMKIGTLPDRMAAYVVRIQDSPVHTLQHLQNLISMVKVQSKQQCIMAADTLKDLFLEDFLPQNMKLQSFDKRGSKLREASKTQLITWLFEDRLKLFYKSFLDALKRMSVDTVEKIRTKSIFIIYKLLTSHPEQEAELLQMLVNKLGDPIKKVGSRALFYLNTLLDNHPRMKIVVVDEVERLLFRNNIARRAQYYGVCFLNTINLHDEHPEVGCKLISVYLAFFKGCIKTGDIDSKMMSGLLTGVNKAYPLAKEYGYKFNDHIDTLYKIVHLSSFNISVQALSILFQMIDVNSLPNEADRYYRTLYKELLHPEVAATSHNLQFLNLIFKSMKCDNNLNRLMGFSKRLLQICLSVQPHLACAIMYLISEVSKTHSGIIRVGKNVSEDCDVDDNVSEESEQNEDSEDDAEKIMDLMKISNVKMNEDSQTVPNEKKQKRESNSKVKALQNVSEESGEKRDHQENISVVDLTTGTTVDEKPTSIKCEYKQNLTEFDPYARNPSYCGAEFSLFHEIVALSDHYHPSVALFANTLLKSQHVSYEGNPLKDFTVGRFLERFVYKNPKKTKTAPGISRRYQPKGLRNMPVNSDAYLRNAEENIPVDEKFFYRYFKEKQPSNELPSDDVSDTESVGDDEFDELMANYFKSGKDNSSDEDESLAPDFAADIHSSATGKKRKKTDDSEDEDENDDLEEDDDDNAFNPDDDADEMVDLDEDDDMLDFNDDDSDFQEEDGLEVFEEDSFDIPAKKLKKKSGGTDMFASADQFAEMLESNVEDILAGPNTLINRDNADPKQLRWETERDRWMKGYKGRTKTIFKSKGKQKRSRK